MSQSTGAICLSHTTKVIFAFTTFLKVGITNCLLLNLRKKSERTPQRILEHCNEHSEVTKKKIRSNFSKRIIKRETQCGDQSYD